MKLDQLHENASGSDFYNIISVQRTDDWGNGTSQQGTINLPYAQLRSLFGRPEVYHEPNRDVNAEWKLDIVYQDKNNASHEDDTETAFVSIWDKSYGEEFSDPSQVTSWRVNAKNREAVWVLDEVIAKGVKAST